MVKILCDTRIIYIRRIEGERVEGSLTPGNFNGGMWCKKFEKACFCFKVKRLPNCSATLYPCFLLSMKKLE